jgi:hypothetical protein
MNYSTFLVFYIKKNQMNLDLFTVVLEGFNLKKKKLKHGLYFVFFYKTSLIFNIKILNIRTYF